MNVPHVTFLHKGQDMEFSRLFLACCGILALSIHSHAFNVKRHARIERQSNDEEAANSTQLSSEPDEEISSSTYPPTEHLADEVDLDFEMIVDVFEIYDLLPSGHFNPMK
ncbi:uncharacterized protein [Parasteatoda tepidariorum]|uniref:uncharacterized protein n=1 Tax=Parasteatoda tepidariorum TaxID=114398 RepID=UPI00077F97A0|nr:uncharacterized protein LOC107450452 [Parasteatoda tepidariorum]